MRVLPFVCLGSWLFAAPSQQPGSTPIAQEKSNPVLRHVKSMPSVWAVWRLAGQPRHLELGDELLVGFSAGYFKDNGPGRHAIDHARPEEHLLARSRDRGQTWSIENPAAEGGSDSGRASSARGDAAWVEGKAVAGLSWRHRL